MMVSSESTWRRPSAAIASATAVANDGARRERRDAEHDPERDAADRRVRDADADEGEPPQHHEEAERAAHDADQDRRHQRALHERELEHQSGRPSFSWCAISPAMKLNSQE